MFYSQPPLYFALLSCEAEGYYSYQSMRVQHCVVAQQIDQK